MNTLLKQVMQLNDREWQNLFEQRRFWKQVDMKNGDECWNWLGCYDNTTGYGVGRINKKSMQSHRIAWIFSTGEILNSMIVVRHKCDNKACCNPNHLETGTHADNINDWQTRLINQKGENNFASKLTEEQVYRMREMAYTGIDGIIIAKEFGISPGAVSMIIRGKAWSHSYDSTKPPKKKYWNRNNSRQLFVPNQIKDIRNKFNQGEGTKNLSLEYKVSRGTIYRIVHRLIYKEIL